LPRAEAIVTALLVVICALFALRAPAAAPLHFGMLVAFAVIVALARQRNWPNGWRAFAIVAVLMTLYSTIAEPAFVAMGGSRDALLAMIDRALLAGRDPALLAERFATTRNVELFSVVYGFFIPYLWLSILLGCIGRPDAERNPFLLGLAITYSIAYLGYLFVPARGPIEHYHFAHALHGGRVYAIVLRSVAGTGGNHGAFPSLHVGASAYLCLFDLRWNPLRGMTYVPLVLLISVSTILLRYHYLIDVLCGLGLAVAASLIVRRAEG
jgi:membrane-associated phospholipid phosphatase